MVNIQKQIEYWINGAEDDIITANLLIQEKRTLHGLFFCHLVIEKAIKAHYVKNSNEIAPRSHNESIITMAKNEVIKLLQSYIYLLRAEGIAVDKAFLYGSYLTNSASPDSDIDLMIVTDNHDDDYLAGKIWKLTRKVSSKIEPFLVAKGRFYGDDNSPLVELVKNTGLEIV